MSGFGAQELSVTALTFLPLIVVILSLIDIMRNEFNGNDKVIWVLVVLFFPIIGSLLYFIIGRKRRL